MTSSKNRTIAPTTPEGPVPEADAKTDAVPDKEVPAPSKSGKLSDNVSEGQDDAVKQERQQAVAILIQGVAIAQAKGGCWSIKQASILNKAIRQVTGNAEPVALPPFDATEAPPEEMPPTSRCIFYLIQGIGFGQAKGAFTLEQAAMLANAIDVLTNEAKAE